MVACPHPDLYRRLQSVFTELGVEQPCSLTDYPRGGAAVPQAERYACNIAFVDVATSTEQAVALIAELSRSVPVVGLHPRIDADLMLRCLRRGACEFVGDPTADAVDAVFERLGRVQAEASHRAAGT